MNTQIVNIEPQFKATLEQDGRTIQVAQVDANPTASYHREGEVSLASISAFPIALSLFGVILFIWFVKNFMQICNPNEILILSGRKHRTKEGEEVGYRVIFGGRVIAIPILETVKRMDLTTMPVPVEVKNAYSKGGTPLHIQAIANVKISGDPAVVGNAIERFLGRDRSEVARVARETLEGNLRGVVAMLTPEQVNEDRLEFAERIAQDVSRDLVKLGLQLDTLKIQSVADDMDYLRSIGRKQIAHIIRDAQIAEAEAVSQAEKIESECQQRAEVAKSQALAVIQQKQNELRTVKAELEQQARSEEERTKAAGKEARARAEQQLQTVRAELERLRLEADRVLPAAAEREAKILMAKGSAAELAENAKASAMVNDLLSEVWQKTGVNAAEVFLLQQIEMILQEAATIPNRMHLHQVNVIDNGDGKSLASLMNVYPEIVRQFLNRVEDTLGIDVSATLNRQNGHQKGEK
ncbi:flotillin family protein [Kovacikia minuta CCNUW1]|uniref:flotillin family protein n=1 Tax=Kovacikia minuta TaxID=2931930 RepID=UPI001CCA63AC|nr:SPFH domain-containing protein [Kovacikia minuta]UBF27212.1 flotillin family protein [Kovacikia minuta CCNUW1]